MTNDQRLSDILDLLVRGGVLHAGQKQDVLNRGKEQARHLLLDKRAELRRLLGRDRVNYTINEAELIASFRFRRHDEATEPVDEELITKLIAKALNLPYRHLDPLRLDFKLVTETFGGPFAERHLVIPLEDRRDALVLAVADPWDREVLESIARLKNKAIEPVLVQKSQLLSVIVEFHGFRRSMRTAELEMQTDLPDLGNLEQLYAMGEGVVIDGADQPIVRAAWYLLNYALDQGCSDIHLEPKRDEGLVRMRIDGILHTVHRLPRVVFPALVSRIKTLSRMDIAERRRPQDGRFKLTHRDNEVELRVSTVPVAFGEKVVIRVFDPGVLTEDIEQLGLFPRELTMVRQMLGTHTGMVLVVGPTGSGKTTTLYAALHHLSSPEVNIVTLEDPIENVHPDFNQIAMQPKIGLTFGSALKNVLRQDPDVVMVGEIRDPETAENAVQAALTGHQVLSTLHTDEAAGAIGRLLDLDVPPFLLSGTLVGVVAQRLVRKVCPFCAQDEVLSEDVALALGIPRARGRRLKVKAPVGCPKCRYTGHKGRTGLFEVMPITPRLQRLINQRAPSQDIKREALNDGMLTLREYGIKKIAAGLTTTQEVLENTDDRLLY
ncbi:MAG: type II/IV secretion system protein [Deltaproteobacteria bacterium]|nr:type II/IV secretion system protein [Deltaproteobacteria bacterium]